MMRDSDVIYVLGLVRGAGLTAWIDGGWGIDALLGATTRQHDDLDLVVRLDEVEAARDVLGDAGFTIVRRNWLPHALAVADETGRSVDPHPVTCTPDGGGDQALLDGGSFHYPPPVSGTIAGRPVPCVDPVTQLRCHTGYDLTDKDRQDIDQLRSRFQLRGEPPGLAPRGKPTARTVVRRAEFI